MPAARYWRLVAIEAHGGADLELSALHLYDATGRADGTATLTSTIAPTAGQLSALQDADLASTCRFAAASLRASGFAIVWDLGAGNSADILGPRLAGPALDTFLASCTLQCSNDGLLWQWVADFGRFDWPGAGIYTNAPEVGDPHWNKVVALLHFDEDLTDEAGGAWTGSAAVVGGKLNTELGIIQSASSSRLVPAMGDFTIEANITLESVDYYGGFIFSHDPNSGGLRGPNLIVSTNNALVFSAVGSVELASSAGLIPVGVETHVAVVRQGSDFRLYIAGQLAASTTFSGSLGQTQYALPTIGRIANTPTDTRFRGLVDEFRITSGVARYTANFTPPTAPFLGPLSILGFLPPLRRTPTAPAPIILSGGSAGDTVMALPPGTTHLDRQDANGTEANAPATRYRIPGPRWVKEKTASTNVPLRRRVQLYNQRDSRLVREVWSDPVTGEYSFDNIRGDTTYFVIAFDHTGHYRAVIADNLTPEPIP